VPFSSTVAITTTKYSLYYTNFSKSPPQILSGSGSSKDVALDPVFDALANRNSTALSSRIR